MGLSWALRMFGNITGLYLLLASSIPLVVTKTVSGHCHTFLGSTIVPGREALVENTSKRSKDRTLRCTNI